MKALEEFKTFNERDIKKGMYIRNVTNHIYLITEIADYTDSTGVILYFVNVQEDNGQTRSILFSNIKDILDKENYPELYL